MTGRPATYGELIDQARRDAHRGMTTVARTAFRDVDAARDALTARGALLSSIGRHAAAVIGPVRTGAWQIRPPARRGIEARTAHVRAIVAWLEALATHADDALPPPSTGEQPVGQAARDWSRARELVEAATDLVHTHHLPGGVMRTGAPRVLADADYTALLAPAIALTLAVSIHEPLALRCRQAGISRRELDQCLPLTDPLSDLAATVGRTMRFHASPITHLTPAGAPIRTGDPADEWRQRTDRIHQRLLLGAARGQVSVRTLHDIASLALVTAHVLTTSGQRPTALSAGMTDQWRAQLAHLAPLRSIAPADRIIRGDVERLIHLAHPSVTAHEPHLKSKLLAAMDHSTRTLDDCAALADRLLRTSVDAWIPGAPRRAYLQDVCPPGTRARRSPPPPGPWPRMAQASSPRAPGWSLS